MYKENCISIVESNNYIKDIILVVSRRLTARDAGKQMVLNLYEIIAIRMTGIISQKLTTPITTIVPAAFNPIYNVVF